MQLPYRPLKMVRENNTDRISYHTIISIAPSGPPTAILVSSLNSTSLSISWSPPLLPHTNGIIQYYIVNVSVAESQANLQYETSSLSLTLNGLHPFYTHTVIVSAVTIAPGPFSNEFVQKLPADGNILHVAMQIMLIFSFFSSQRSSTEH